MDINSPVILLGALVGSIVSMRVFFTLWGPIDRKLNPEKPFPVGGPLREIASELKDAPLHVRFTSGLTLENVVLTGRCVNDLEEMYEMSQMSQMLVLRALDGREFFARAEEIEYFERAPAVSPLNPALELPLESPLESPHIAPDPRDPDAPESW